MDKARLIQHDMNHIQKVYKEQQHDFFAVTIRPQESFIRQFEQSDRTEVVQELTLSVIKKVQSHLIRKPMRNSTKHLLIDHINVIETKTKYGSKDIEHQHGLWIVHKDISQRLNEKFINQITQSSSFKLYDQKYRFVDAMHPTKEVPMCCSSACALTHMSSTVPPHCVFTCGRDATADIVQILWARRACDCW